MLERFENLNQWTIRNIFNGKYLGLTQPSNLKDGAPLQGVISAVPWEIVPNETDSTVL
ncbi:hypothetical protein C0989_003410, partial [Termitomyces sp. Mn162]